MHLVHTCTARVTVLALCVCVYVCVCVCLPVCLSVCLSVTTLVATSLSFLLSSKVHTALMCRLFLVFKSWNFEKILGSKVMGWYVNECLLTVVASDTIALALHSFFQ